MKMLAPRTRLCIDACLVLTLPLVVVRTGASDLKANARAEGFKVGMLILAGYIAKFSTALAATIQVNAKVSGIDDDDDIDESSAVFILVPSKGAWGESFSEGAFTQPCVRSCCAGVWMRWVNPRVGGALACACVWKGEGGSHCRTQHQREWHTFPHARCFP